MRARRPIRSTSRRAASGCRGFSIRGRRSTRCIRAQSNSDSRSRWRRPTSRGACASSTCVTLTATPSGSGLTLSDASADDFSAAPRSEQLTVEAGAEEERMTGDASVLGSLHSVDGEGVVRMEDRFHNEIDDLWGALTDPERLARWYGEVEGDLSRGGEFRLRITLSGDRTGTIEAC